MRVGQAPCRAGAGAPLPTNGTTMTLAGLEPAIFGSEDHALSIRPQGQVIRVCLEHLQCKRLGHVMGSHAGLCKGKLTFSLSLAAGGAGGENEGSPCDGALVHPCRRLGKVSRDNWGRSGVDTQTRQKWGSGERAANDAARRGASTKAACQAAPCPRGCVCTCAHAGAHPARQPCRSRAFAKPWLGNVSGSCLLLQSVRPRPPERSC